MMGWTQKLYLVLAFIYFDVCLSLGHSYKHTYMQFHILKILRTIKEINL